MKERFPKEQYDDVVRAPSAKLGRVDIEKVLRWFTDDCVCEDTTIGHGAEGTGKMRKFGRS